MRRFVRAFPLVLFIAGFGLLVVGVLYLITPVEALPRFLGGSLRAGLHAGNYHTKRADVALFLGLGCLVASGWLYARSVQRPSTVVQIPPSVNLERSEADGRPRS